MESITDSGRGVRARSACPPLPDGLKMNSAQMKKTELQMFWKLVKSGEDRPLAAAELRLLLRVRLALMDYQDEIKLGHQAFERRCVICRVPVSQCCC